MNKETSSRVSSIAAAIMNRHPMPEGESTHEGVARDKFNELLADAKILAGSCMSQDETPGQAAPKSQHGIHPAPTEFSAAILAENPILQFFHYKHLPPMLQRVSNQFCDLAIFIVHNLPRNAERTVALRKLLEAKDAAVRANLPAPDLGQRQRSVAQTELGEPKEIINADEGRDGPPAFNG